MAIAVGVSMDAFAVSICKGLSVSVIRPRNVVSVGLWFGGFQAIMPLIGYFAGIHFSDFVSSLDHWIAFVLLGLIGANMIRESKDPGHDGVCPDFSFRTMLSLAVATSIDALAIGISLAFLRVNIWNAVILIGITTAVFSMAGFNIGNHFGTKYKSTAELLGGAILILIGIKILIEHTLM